MHVAKPIGNLIKELSRLPGIGEKTAARLAFYILNSPREYCDRLVGSIREVKNKVIICSKCFNLSDNDPCDLCCDMKRARDTLCVVKEPSDIAAIEAAGRYKGAYHVLHGCLSPLNGIGPDDIRIMELRRRVEEGSVKEVIIALSPNMDGEATALFIAKLLKPLGVDVTRLATGIPVGGELGYMDNVTIGKAFEGRRGV